MARIAADFTNTVMQSLDVPLNALCPHSCVTTLQPVATVPVTTAYVAQRSALAKPSVNFAILDAARLIIVENAKQLLGLLLAHLLGRGRTERRGDDKTGG